MYYLRLEMVSLRNYTCSRDDVLMHCMATCKLTFLSGLELGALLSSYIEGVFYEFLMNEEKMRLLNCLRLVRTSAKGFFTPPRDHAIKYCN